MFPKRLYFFFYNLFFLNKKVILQLLKTSSASFSNFFDVKSAVARKWATGKFAAISSSLVPAIYIRCCGAGTTDVASELVMVENNRLLSECGLSVPPDGVESLLFATWTRNSGLEGVGQGHVAHGHFEGYM